MAKEEINKINHSEDCISTRSQGNQLFSPPRKDLVGGRLHIHHALSIMRIRVYKPKMVPLKVVLFSLIIICKAIQAYLTLSVFEV